MCCRGRVFSWVVLLSTLSGAAHLHGQTPAPGGVTVYEVRGTCQSADPARHQVTIAHEAIPGFMPAMTMDFDCRDPVSLPALHAGQALSFRLCVTATAAWVEQIRPAAPADAASPAPAVPPAPGELQAGDLLPDSVFTDALGQSVRLGDLRGQALAITFIYARCPLPTYCPLMNRNFQAAQTLLTRLGGDDHWRFLSVSMDATHDTPAVLSACAAAYGADTRHWTFVTASVETVRLFGRSVGLEFSLSGGRINHNLRTIVVNTAGRIQRIFPGNFWTPQELAAEVRAAMRPAGHAAN